MKIYNTYAGVNHYELDTQIYLICLVTEFASILSSWYANKLSDTITKYMIEFTTKRVYFLLLTFRWADHCL